MDQSSDFEGGIDSGDIKNSVAGLKSGPSSDKCQCRSCHKCCNGVFKRWFHLALVFSIICGLIYIVVQQNYRMSANDPQVAISQEIAHNLSLASNKADMQTILSGVGSSFLYGLGKSPVDMTQSLMPFVIIYDSKGKPLFSTASLNGLVPVPPSGVFDYVGHSGEDRFTWQPQEGLRYAVVVVRFSTNYIPQANASLASSTPAISQTPSSDLSTSNASSGGFILVGRSLQEVESGENQLLIEVFISWFLGIILTFLMVLVF